MQHKKKISDQASVCAQIEDKEMEVSEEEHCNFHKFSQADMSS